MNNFTKGELEDFVNTIDLDSCTSTEYGGKEFKLDLNDILEAKLLLENSTKSKSSMFGIPIFINPLVPDGEIWCINNKEDIYKIINIGNSKIYKFILWCQKVIQIIKAKFINQIIGE
jgi:hypothetical protein